MEEKTFTVSEINALINRKLKMDPSFKNILVKGEISNFSTNSFSGHSYFTLKDENSQIDAVMFKGMKDRFLKIELKDGMKVIIKGKIEVYVKNGKYQLYATKITEDGIGNLYVAFEQLKKKLEKEGLFEKSHKKTIPKYPKKIGVVTAPTGAAIRDILTTIKKRYPICEILIFPTLVQGDHAKEQIVRQIRNAQRYDIDTLIVGRGGGSIEDLWPFNEESVAREIYDCEIPVISAVGHEVDFTISDFVADERAPTPTGAAQIAVPELKEVEFKVDNLKEKLTKNITNKIGENRLILKHISEKQVLKNPEEIYEIKEMHLDNLINKLDYASKNIITENKQKLFKLENATILKNPQNMLNNKKEKYYKNLNKLEVLNPLLTLKRGYSIAKSEGKILSSAKDVKTGDKIDIEFDDGTVNTKVI
ncbi:MAG: exodeoxyribonuclease VII large subunit [Methanobrevibacter sp.]|uniref:exodeoxyribonuclease VII large subunit n=1 Tax=Methanobrevibacter sp. TaxID=66852 RepID=UPI0025E29CD5|nr:exodeoxyribonuclease VII large subunit [Methanobrevibacter sp.]MBQ8017602.1 exodeoxyribonuclease VII large subunit [Methanobrevibacter sp.]